MKTHTLFIWFIGMLLFITLGLGGACSSYIRQLRGYPIQIYALVTAIGAVVSIFGFLLAYLAKMNTRQKGRAPLLIFPAFLIIYILTLQHFFLQTCHK